MIETKKELDTEWVELIKEAKELGITIEEIQQFLESCSKPVIY
ncbi:anti-repressor SinI family protein [Virgibacillus oceani]|uniref:Sin domain-containing protein n=1 Tax=Virgibacillus oceani TaxID=1479511 RepID=A0A917M2Y8_9BACI|nr:anti-repressor SinI family protein [Virgibacillus oceani]GGG74461.1 hypothetical protein GCM10011398_18930 [Virgibacillus oceani]